MGRKVVIKHVLEQDSPCVGLGGGGGGGMQDTTYMMSLMDKIYWPKNMR